jgi:hypothetical protein
MTTAPPKYDSCFFLISEILFLRPSDELRPKRKKLMSLRSIASRWGVNSFIWTSSNSEFCFFWPASPTTHSLDFVSQTQSAPNTIQLQKMTSTSISFPYGISWVVFTITFNRSRTSGTDLRLNERSVVEGDTMSNTVPNLVLLWDN